MTEHSESLHDELAYIETMSAEELRQELREAIKSHQECLVSNWHEKKELRAVNSEMQLSLKNGNQTLAKAAKDLIHFREVMDKATASIVMWRRSCYALAGIFIILACWVLIQGGTA